MSALPETSLSDDNHNHTPAAGLLEQIATASLLEEKNQFNPGSLSSDDVEDDSDEEVFEDGDEGEESEEGRESGDEIPHGGVAAVLTELSQVAAAPVGPANNSAFPLPTRPIPNPNMTATINSINSLLQSHLHGHVMPSSLPQKARLYGPIRANVNIRHGVWAPRLRCRKRKNLHAKDGIWINPTCTLEHLINLVKGVLPDEFEWDPQASPLRYQAVNDQSLQSLKTVSGTVASGQSLFSAFDLVRNRRSDGDNFILQLYVYGTWTVLLKPHMNPAYLNSSGVSVEDDHCSSISLPPPPKKKYQQAHYNQMQHEESSLGQNSGMFHMRLSPPVSNNNSTNITPTSSYYTHPLAANPPVTFLPTVTLEMKLNGTFLPVEVSRRSFIAAIRACSLPKPASNATATENNAAGSSTTPPPNTNNNTNTNTNNNTITPPPSDA